MYNWIPAVRVKRWKPALLRFSAVLLVRSCAGSSLQCMGFPLSWLLLLQSVGFVAPWHMGSSQTRNRTCVPCTGRWILNLWTTKKKKGKSLSRVLLFATLWTVAYEALPSMGFSRQEYWSGLPFPSPEDLPDPGIKSQCHRMFHFRAITVWSCSPKAKFI